MVVSISVLLFVFFITPFGEAKTFRFHTICV